MEKEIAHKVTSLYSPESNGQTERLSRTMLNMARAVLTN